MADTPVILVVEDEPGLRQAYKIVLEANSYTVFTAADGEEGLICLRKEHPRLVLLDMLMPKLDGLGFLRRAHLPEEFPDTKVIAFSNLSNTQRLDELHRLGIYDHVLKADINPGQLVQLIRDALEAAPGTAMGNPNSQPTGGQP